LNTECPTRGRDDISVYILYTKEIVGAHQETWENFV